MNALYTEESSTTVSSLRLAQDTSGDNPRGVTEIQAAQQREADSGTVSSSTTATAEEPNTATVTNSGPQQEDTEEVVDPANDAITDTGEIITSTTEVTTTEATTETTVDFDDLAGGINLSDPSWDMFLAGFFIVGALLYGWSLGKDRIIAILVSIYMALAVVAALPDFVLNIKVNESYTFQITAFIAIFVVLFFMLSRQAVLNSLSPNSDGKWWQTLLFSILHVGLLVSVTMTLLPPNIASNFSDLTLYIFTNQWTAFGWIIAPILAMIFLGKSAEA